MVHCLWEEMVVVDPRHFYICLPGSVLLNLDKSYAKSDIGWT
jgi:hypothetical protein